MPVSLNTADRGDDAFPAEIYARHLKCSPPGGFNAWRKYSLEYTYPEIRGSSDLNNNDYPQQDCSVQVKLELGHKAITRKKPTPEGFTHDWTMFVRGPEGSNIQHFVDRVVFFLHESFPKPKRVVKEPPYQINESGYAGFNLPIEIYFKNKDDPKKITFSYDLFLHTPNSPPVNHVRCEKLTFQNPSEEFRRKLVKAGGMAILGPNDPTQTQTLQTSSPSPTQANTPESKAFADLFGAPSKTEGSQKKHKSHSSKDRSGGRTKSSSSSQGSGVSPLSAPAASTPPPAVITPPSTPSKEVKPAGSQAKPTKEKTGKRPAEQGSSADMSKKKRKDNNGDSVERSKDREDKKDRDKQEKEEKEKKEKERKKEKKSSSKESKSKHKSSKKDSAKGGKAEESKVIKQSSSPPISAYSTPPHPQPPPPPPPPTPPPPTQPEVKTVAAKKDMPISEQLSPGEISPFDDDDLDMDLPPELLAAACSPASTLSFSSMKGPSGAEGGGPLGALFAEMEDEEVPLSPLPITSDSPPLPSPRLPPPPDKVPKAPKDSEPALRGKQPSPLTEPVKAPPTKTKKKDKESRRSRSDRRTKEASKENKDTTKDTTTTTLSTTNSKSAKDVIAKDLFRDYHDQGKENGAEDKVPSGPSKDPTDLGERDLNNMQPGSGAVVAPNGESLNVLLELQRRLMGMTDRDLVQQVVNVIEETGMYKISDATFDFDLCSLDINTVKKLQVCLEMAC